MLGMRSWAACLAAIIGFGMGGATPASATFIQNGSFETGDFTGWSTATTGSPFRPWAVTGGGQGGGFGMAQTSPQDGSFVAWNGFDGGGPMEFRLWQDVPLFSGTSARLEWKHRVQWNFGPGSTATERRMFDVSLLDPSDESVLAVLSIFTTGTQATSPTGDTGWSSASVDVSAYIGRSVRLMFRAHIPQNLTGPGQLELDAIGLTTIAEPATLALLGAGLAGLGIARRRRAGRRSA